MHISALEIKNVARERGPDQPSHPLLPPPIIAFTQHWLKLAHGKTPAWANFDMFDVAESAPYLTILKARGSQARGSQAYDLEFVGSGIAALVEDDITGQTATADDPMVGDIDWYARATAAADKADIQVSSGTINPQYTSTIEYVSADFPFADETGAITHVVCVTVATLN